MIQVVVEAVEEVKRWNEGSIGRVLADQLIKYLDQKCLSTYNESWGIYASPKIIAEPQLPSNGIPSLLSKIQIGVQRMVWKWMENTCPNPKCLVSYRTNRDFWAALETIIQPHLLTHNLPPLPFLDMYTLYSNHTMQTILREVTCLSKVLCLMKICLSKVL